MARSHSDSPLFDLLQRSAVAGVGLSAGRDIYKASKDSLFLLIVAALTLCGTAYGMWNMTRGHDRGPIGTFFVTFLLNAILMGASLALFMLVFVFVAPFFHEWKGEDPLRDVAVAGLSVQGVLAVIGLALGLKERPRRTAARKVGRDNAAFLASNGFRDVGGRQNVILDRDGNELVPDDFRADAVVFKVRGRRGVRAKIILDGQGRMVSYVPA